MIVQIVYHFEWGANYKDRLVVYIIYICISTYTAILVDDDKLHNRPSDQDDLIRFY